jgi:hypothetical protein
MGRLSHEINVKIVIAEIAAAVGGERIALARRKPAADDDIFIFLVVVVGRGVRR